MNTESGKGYKVKAFISDIHANIEALCAVMKDIEGRGVNEIICLGDIVGYGPDPEACIDFIMQIAKITLMGNHDTVKKSNAMCGEGNWCGARLLVGK